MEETIKDSGITDYKFQIGVGVWEQEGMSWEIIRLLLIIRTHYHIFYTYIVIIVIL